MYKIGLVTSRYQISHRTLRYWEEAGILKSFRGENNYRYYDENNLNRIKQILFFRRLNLPIKDIESIFTKNDLTYTVDILKQHLENIKNQEQAYKLLSNTLEYLLRLIEDKKDIADMIIDLDELNNNPIDLVINSSNI